MSPYDYFEQIEKPCAAIFNAMSNRGICIDVPYLEKLKDKLEKQKAPLEAEIKNELGDINLDSPKQLLKALNAKGLYPQNGKGPSTDKEALEKLADAPIIQNLQARNQLETLLSVFVDKYLERKTSIVHPFFNQCGTRTGRPSCSNPNLLQIPKHNANGQLVRRMFIPRSSMLLGDCDYGQIEPRLMAHLSKDKGMCSLFNEGSDFHTYFAERLGIERQKAKVFDLETYYRATKYGVAKTLKCSVEEAEKEIARAWNLFPSLRRWQDKLMYEARRSGFITTLLGRRIRIEGLDDPSGWRREAAERQLINNLIQASAAEVMKLAMIKCVNEIPHFGLLIQVYDQLVFEAPIEHMRYIMPEVRRCMTTAINLEVPLEVDCKTGINWGEVK